MQVINRRGAVKTHGIFHPSMVILHHTVTPSVRSAENGLNSRRGGLGYHFIVDTNGDVYQYGGLLTLMYHAAGYNSEAIGIAMVGGGDYGPLTEVQVETVIQLINENIRPNAPEITYVTGHKHASRNGKIDPRFKGEPPLDVNWKIDAKYMQRISDATGLTFVNKQDLGNGNLNGR